MSDDAAPPEERQVQREPEVFDHTVKKPRHQGAAILAAFFFFGGGQLVKRHFRRFLWLWGILIATVAVFAVIAISLDRNSDLRRFAGEAFPFAIGALYFYAVFDAANRPDDAGA